VSGLDATIPLLLTHCGIDAAHSDEPSTYLFPNPNGRLWIVGLRAFTSSILAARHGFGGDTEHS
jgi:hypothetical protein